MLSGRILQEFYLVWLDENDSVCRNDIVQLRQVINTVNVLIIAITDYVEIAFMLVSETFATRLIPVVESISQIKSTYLYFQSEYVE